MTMLNLNQWLGRACVVPLTVLALSACGDSGPGDGAADGSGESDVVDATGDAVVDIAEQDAGTDSAATDVREPPRLLDVFLIDSASSPDGTTGTDAIANIDAAYTPDLSGLFDAFGDIAGGGDRPYIDFVDPASGPITGGTFVVGFGSGLTPSTTVLVGGVPASEVDVVDEFTIAFLTPAYDFAGPVDIKVVSRYGESVSPGAFRYVAELELDSIEPATGPVRGGLPVTLRGRGIGRDSSVNIGSATALDIQWVSDTEIRATVPPGVVGPADVRVLDGAQVAILDDGFSYFAEPTITAITPAWGPDDGGTVVTVEGSGLVADSAVTFDGAPASVTSRDLQASPQRLVVRTPAGDLGPADVVVTGAFGSVGVEDDGFIYFSDDEPGLVGLYPSRGPEVGGTQITIIGSGLETASAVTIGGIAATLDSASANEVRVTTPPGSGSGDVVVTTDAGVYTLNNAWSWVALPTFASIVPASGTARGGESVVVTGSGFVPGTTVTLGARAVLGARIVSPTRIEFTTPPGVVGTADVVISVPVGGSVTAPDAYTYEDELSVTAMRPSRGAIAGGTMVVLRGTGFGEDAVVRFGDEPAVSITVIDSTTLEVYTPPGAVGSVPVVVDFDDDTASAPLNYTYFEPWRDTGGWWGAPIEGAVNVTVVNGDNGERVPEAYVTLNLRVGATRYSGFADDNGQITFSGVDVRGPQTVSAIAPEFGGGTVTRFDAENVIISLFPIAPPSDGEPPPPPDFPTISGLVSGLDKITDPAPGESLVAIIRTSTPGPGGSNPDGTGYAQVTAQPNVRNYPYEMDSRIGQVAVVAICGVRNDSTGEFRPILMGIQRGIAMREGVDQVVNVVCEIPMDVTLAFKFVNSPFAAGGPDVNLAFPLLDLGSDGGIDLLTYGEGRAAIIEVDDLVDVGDPRLGGGYYFMVGQVDTAAGGPVSVTFVDRVTDMDALVVFEPFVPPAQFTFPTNGGDLVDRRVEWRTRSDAEIDFHMVFITDFSPEQPIHWFTFVPGDERVANLPMLPADLPEGYNDLPRGQLILVVRSVDAIEFDYDSFDDNDFSQANWESYAENAIVIFN